MSINCNHPCCGEVCRREPKTKKAKTPLKRTPLKRQTTQIKRSPIKRTYKPKKKVKGVDEWFVSRASEMCGICCNCGERSSARSGSYWKWSICHVIPKSDFPSVATHPSNFIELCISCHTLYDRSLAVAHTLYCWPIAVAKFRLFEKEITEKRKFLDFFKKLADEINTPPETQKPH